VDLLHKRKETEWFKDVGFLFLKLVEGIDVELRGNDGKQTQS